MPIKKKSELKKSDTGRRTLIEKVAKFLYHKSR